MSFLKKFNTKSKGKDDGHTNPQNSTTPEPEQIKHTQNQPDNHKILSLEDVPQFKDVPKDQHHALFLQKMKVCQTMFLWRPDVTPSEDPQAVEKDLKLQHLLDLLDYVNQNPKGVFTPETHSEVLEFVSANLFRQTFANPIPDYVEYDPEEDEPLLELSWPHLQLVMEFFLRFIVSSDVDPKTSKKIIDQSFITKLLTLFDSEDSRERDSAKTLLHRLYGKFMQHRPFIRKAINDLFYQFAFYSQRHNGIAELLEILGAIINGFAIPLKEEHKVFLKKVLLPLHKPKQIALYHSQLTYCVTQFCEKDSSLAPVVLLGLLRYWPQSNPPKAILFLNELEEVMEATEPEDLHQLLIPIFSLLNKCILSSFQVAERALCVWDNEYILSFITENYRTILPLIIESLTYCTRGHWNANVNLAAVKVVKVLTDIDSTFFVECARQFKEKTEREQHTREERESEWLKYEQTAKTNDTWKPPFLKQISVLEASKVEGLAPEIVAIRTHFPFALPQATPNNPMYSKSRYGRL